MSRGSAITVLPLFMSKIRINELARQLEIPSHEIIDMLPELGVTEKKTHSSSVDEPVAGDYPPESARWIGQPRCAQRILLSPLPTPSRVSHPRGMSRPRP